VITASFVISATHPCLPGHFPGNPIAPGVVTLDHVAQGLLEQIEGVSLAGFPQVKFLKPLKPGVTVLVAYQEKNETTYQFNCEVDGQVILTGQIKLALNEGENL